MSDTQKKSFDFSIESLLRVDQNKQSKGQLCDVSVNHVDDSFLIPVTPFDASSDPELAFSSSKLEINATRSPENLETFSWLHCTRFKPPKLPRSRKRGHLGKRVGRGPRIPFSPHQIAILENTFSNSQYLSSECINRLANALHLSETRVKIWFQNRRARFRREKDARDCQDLSTSGLNDTKKSVHEKDLELEKVTSQAKSYRKRNALMTSAGHFVAFQIQSELSAGIPNLSSTYKDLENNTNYSLASFNDLPLFHRPHTSPFNEPRLADFEYLHRNSNVGMRSLMIVSEDRKSTTGTSNILSSPYSHIQHNYQPQIY